MLDPGFMPLEIVGNPRSDWREYWGIRHYFLENVLEETSYYGFLSPLFRTKTHLTAKMLASFMKDNPDADVYTFSPSLADSACYLNVFEHGEKCHPGMLSVTEDFFRHIDVHIDFKSLINDFRTSVFCNYIIAKPVFWRRWFALTERIFDIAEYKKNDLSARLNTAASYGKSQVQTKVFVIERIASALLALTPQLKIANYQMPFVPLLYFPCRDELRMLNALKLAYMKSQRQHYLDDYLALRQSVLIRCDPEFTDEQHIVQL